MSRLGALVALALVIAGCGYAPSAHVQFATIDVTPAWSPDGRWIAFASSREGGGIYLVASDGDRLRRIVRGAASDPTWSPDGSELAYSGIGGVYLVRPGARPVHVLRGRFSLPAWAPDGRLAVVRTAADYSTTIELVDRDGRGMRPLVSGTDPAWSPDGRELAFEDASGGIAVVRVAGRHVRRFVAAGIDPAWSPSGRLIAFQSALALWIANADGTGEPMRIDLDVSRSEAVAAEGGYPAWAPDSSRLVVEVKHDRARYTRRASSLSIVDVRTGETRRLTYGGSTLDDPTWRDPVVGKASF